MLIAFTGKSGTGKTVMLKELDYGNIVFMDEEIQKAYKSKGELYPKVKEVFGRKYVGLTKVNSKKLGKLVFTDEAAMKALEKITQPFIKKMLTKLKKEDKVTIVEMGSYINYVNTYKKYFDKVVLLEGDRLAEKFEHVKEGFQPIKDIKVKADLVLQNSDWDKSIVTLYDLVRAYQDFEYKV